MIQFSRSLLFLFALSLSVSTAIAQNEPDLVKERYFSALANATTQEAGRAAENDLWEYWLDQSPTPEIRALMDKGMERRKAYDYEAAELAFDEVIALAPEYSEGYNQRAFVRFLREKIEPALSDLEKTLELEPRHFGALSGMYHILRLKNRTKAAMRTLQFAVAIHPWIKERNALPENMRPKRKPVQKL